MTSCFAREYIYNNLDLSFPRDGETQPTFLNMNFQPTLVDGGNNRFAIGGLKTQKINKKHKNGYVDTYGAEFNMSDEMSTRTVGGTCDFQFLLINPKTAHKIEFIGAMIRSSSHPATASRTIHIIFNHNELDISNRLQYLIKNLNKNEFELRYEDIV